MTKIFVIFLGISRCMLEGFLETATNASFNFHYLLTFNGRICFSFHTARHSWNDVVKKPNNFLSHYVDSNEIWY